MSEIRTPPEVLARENAQVINLVQALIGSISPNMRAISIEVLAERHIRLHFVLERDDPADREEIEEVEFQFEAYQMNLIDVDLVVAVSAEPDATDLPGRRVYVRRESR